MPKKQNSDLRSQESDNNEQLEVQIAELNEALLRERADAMNIRRRADEDRLKMAGYYKAVVLRELLPAIDNLERALQHQPANDDWAKGIESIYKHLLQTLEKLGVERIKTVGEVFDPALHEAVVMEDGDGQQEMVSEELQSGWRLGDEILRHAMVKVRS